jgi:hypothetical protein
MTSSPRLRPHSRISRPKPLVGQMSTVQNAKHVLLHGLNQARGEWPLSAACHNQWHRHSAPGYRTPAEDAAACRHTHTPCEIN